MVLGDYVLAAAATAAAAAATATTATTTIPSFTRHCLYGGCKKHEYHACR